MLTVNLLNQVRQVFQLLNVRGFQKLDLSDECDCPRKKRTVMPFQHRFYLSTYQIFSLGVVIDLLICVTLALVRYWPGTTRGYWLIALVLLRIV